MNIVPPPNPPFTYVGTSTAAAMTTGVLNTALFLAEEKSTASQAKLTEALVLSDVPPQIAAPTDLSAIVLPPLPLVGLIDPAEAQALYDSAKNEITQLLTNAFATFFTVYFPLGAELEVARSWIEDAIAVGGSGINQAVEDQLWQRDRDRVLKDAARAEDEQITAWSARGFPLPPGALAHSLLMIQRDSMDKIGESSRAQAAKVFETEIENVRLAVDKAISLRTQAISSASEYIRTLVLGPQVGAQLASTLLDAEAKVAGIATDFYRAQVASLEVPLRIGTTNAELKQRTNEANQKASLETTAQRVAGVIAQSNMLGSQAAAMLNGFHAQVAIGGSESL
jgi:hypothetical protein